MPGRNNETWFKADREGVYYGQCSKICGKDHAFMPIAFRVVSDEQYQTWLAAAKKKLRQQDRPYEEQYLILVTCADEAEQLTLLERFQQEGLKCQAKIA